MLPAFCFFSEPWGGVYDTMMTMEKSSRYGAFPEKVYAVVARIPRGSVLTYKEVARRAGYPGAARAVGNALNKNPDMKKVPCHRVVRSDGVPGGYARGTAKKRSILRKEGALGRDGKARLAGL